MDRYTFSCESESRTVGHTNRAETLFEVITDFEHFLRGCSFVFDGSLDIISDDETTISLEEYKEFQEWKNAQELKLEMDQNKPDYDFGPIENALRRTFNSEVVDF